MYKAPIIILSAIVLQACSSVPSEVLTGSYDCGHIGCADGGLRVYPNEEFAASVQPRKWYGWEWGETSSAYSKSDPKYHELKAKECAHLLTLELDCNGRPL
jgi:hypothetical protein